MIALLHGDVLALRNQVFDRLDAIRLVRIARRDDDPPLGLVVAPELDTAGDIRDDRVILGAARPEQLRHTRQTGGDVAGLRALPRYAGDNVSGLHVIAGLDVQDRIDRNQEIGSATDRERECQNVSTPRVAISIKNKKSN